MHAYNKLKKEVLESEKSQELIMEENTPRNVWPLGVITQVKEGRDGIVRSVCIRTKATTLVRPVTKVVLLERSLS